VEYSLAAMSNDVEVRWTLTFWIESRPESEQF